MSEPNLQPPRSSLLLVRWLCRHDLAEEIEGNLIEYYQQTRDRSTRFAAIRYWFQVINYLRPSTLKRFKSSKVKPMFIFNPLFTIRSLFKQGSSTLINILGFSLGLVCVLFLYFHIKSELSYDSFHTDKDKIYRALRIANPEEGTELVGVTSGPFAPALQNDFPNSISSTCRAIPSDALVSFEDKSFIEENILMADSNFFSFFSFPLLSGTADQVLSGVNDVVLHKDLAKKYFGDQDPIGKIIQIDNELEFIVKGIMDDFPAKSHMDFNMVGNINLLNLEGWWNNGLITYVKIETPEEADYVNGQLEQFMDKYFGEDFAANDFRLGLMLESLSGMYFHSDISFDRIRHGDLNSIYILGAVGLAILLIACFNYVNLSIAQSFRRAREIAVRKVLGGDKLRITLQLMGESLTILLFSSAIAVGLSMLLHPVFNNYFQLDVSLNWSDPALLMFGGALLFTTLLVAGLYPALLISSFNPVKVLKGGKSSSGKNVLVRKLLVVSQFLIAIFMISATLLISRQMQFVQTKDLGFDREAVMTLDINNSAIRNNIESFKDAFADEPDILSISAVGGEPSGFHDITLIELPGNPENQRINIGWGDEDYFETFGINIIVGRSFSQNLESDLGNTAVINRKAMEMLGFTTESVLEQRVLMTSWDLDLRVIGVTENYHFSTLKEQMEPLIIVHGLRYRKLAIKMNAANLVAAMEAIDDKWEQFSPEYPMQYEFLDESVAQQYENEVKQSKVFTAFSAISIFLACMGVFGLATYTARQKQKELGIRKVLGATARQIIGLLSREVILLIGLASLIAIPVAWYFIDQWLNDFAYQISIMAHWPLFLASGLAVALVAFLTIGLKTYRAAVSNPTESIRYE